MFILIYLIGFFFCLSHMIFSAYKNLDVGESLLISEIVLYIALSLAISGFSFIGLIISMITWFFINNDGKEVVIKKCCKKENNCG